MVWSEEKRNGNAEEVGKQKLNRINMGQVQCQNIEVEIVDMQEKGTLTQAKQMKSQTMLNVETVILKGIKSNGISEIFTNFFPKFFWK